MGGSIGGINIDKDKVDAWTASMRGAFGGTLPMATTLLIIGLTIAVVVAIVWFTSTRGNSSPRRHA